ARYDHVEPPAWMRPDDPLRATYAQSRELLRSGHVIWGHVVQANNLLFQPGDADCPAAVLYGAGPDDLPPDRLLYAAVAAYALKNAKPADPAAARIAAV